MFIFRLLAPLLLAVLAYWGLVRIQRKYALNQQQFRWLIVITAVLLVVLILIVMGRLPIQALAAPAIFILTFALRNAHWLLQLTSWLRGRRTSGPGGGRRSGRSSVNTDWLAMELAHSTGQMDGTVLKGMFQGQRLSALTLTELLELAQACQHDADSLQLLEAYLERVHPGWQENAGAAHGAREDSSAEGSMNETLALEILGLSPGATEDQIVAAHRRLMQKLHPDRGGSDYLAQRINAARDFLLSRIG
ncbi:DnaJ domain-containing protein [Pseudohongiella spirulinae]|uniref:Molecular chaperone DnaJ n=1 Tax=Pseudohongiella spirulinae TaxID=1249552 RepID=A0A0S2KFG1_9GAMM|nr:DnaJ domain-containing protein [Pseudohongiella spirulinae]ALO46851.1 Molecular chaperone DnaJ [Pseudohongiella spirulinae]